MSNKKGRPKQDVLFCCWAWAACVQNYFDIIINTVSAPLDLNQYLATLRLDGTMVLLGVPPEAPQINAFNLRNCLLFPSEHAYDRRG